MLRTDKTLTAKYAGQKVTEEALAGRGYFSQDKKKSHTGIPAKGNVWVRDMVCADSCDDAHMMVAVILDHGFHIASVAAAIRFVFTKTRFEDMPLENFPPQIWDRVESELKATVAGVCPPRGFKPVGRPLPKMLREAPWKQVGDSNQWRCQTGGLTWNCEAPRGGDRDSIAVNNSFFTTISTPEARDLNMVITISTDGNANVSSLEVKKFSGSGFTRPGYVKPNRSDEKTAKLLFIELETGILTFGR